MNLSNFINTNDLQWLGRLFYNCNSLENVDLSTLITTKAKAFDYMFYNCTSLTSINLANCVSSSVDNFTSMFFNCKKLEYINLKNVDDNLNLTYKYIF